MLRPAGDDQYLCDEKVDDLTSRVRVFARAKPADKLEIVKSLQRQGLVCAMSLSQTLVDLWLMTKAVELLSRWKCCIMFGWVCDPEAFDVEQHSRLQVQVLYSQYM